MKMAKYGQMDSRSWALYLANKAAMTFIRRVSRDPDRQFRRWFRFVDRRGKRHLGRTYFGAAISCDIHDHITNRIFFFHVWEQANSALIEASLRSGDIFVDVGANVGYDTLLASKKVGSSGKVIAIEASSSIHEQLRANLDRNGVRNVRLVRAAASDAPGELTLYGGDAGNQGRTSTLDRTGLIPIETVPALPLDQILHDDERENVRLIKIDIEGAETPLLERLVETLDQYPADMSLLVEMSQDETGRSERVFTKLLEAGYKAYAIPNYYTLRSYLVPNKAEAPKRATTLPAEQVDIYFTRGDLPQRGVGANDRAPGASHDVRRR